LAESDEDSRPDYAYLGRIDSSATSVQAPDSDDESDPDPQAFHAGLIEDTLAAQEASCRSRLRRFAMGLNGSSRSSTG